MSITCQIAKDDLSGRLHGTSANKVTNLLGVFRRAGNNLLSKIDPEETRRTKQITLYRGVYDYAAESDLKDKKVVDIRPQSDRADSDNARQVFSKEFDRHKTCLKEWLTVETDSGVKFLRIAKKFLNASSSFDDLRAIGGWVAGGNASGLAVENVLFPEGALEFNLAAAGSSGHIESSTIDSADLTDYENKSSAFFTLYIPTAAALVAATGITGINLRWGNSDSVYFDRTVTVQHLGALRVGRNLIRVDWNGATETGSVNVAAIDYSRITITYGGTAIPGIIVSRMFFSIGKIHDILYYSKYLFTLTAGTLSDAPTLLTDSINLDTPTYNIFLDELALEATQQIQGEDSAADRNFIDGKLHGGDGKVGSYSNYKTDNPSQALKPQGETRRIRGFRKK